jgi:glycosyltransferase involved in cell wall biosynthesis
MKSADIYSAHFIVASSGDRDGLPTTVIEAALAKLPIIATDAGSMADLINKDTGVVIPQKDPVALANSIKHLIEDSSLRDKLVSKVYSEAIKNFDINQNILELEKMFLS